MIFAVFHGFLVKVVTILVGQDFVFLIHVVIVHPDFMLDRGFVLPNVNIADAHKLFGILPGIAFLFKGAACVVP